jgi:hypothetical protein
LRVKGGGYGFASDDLTDAFRGVEEIGKVHGHKNSVASVECTVVTHKERGRLDKSYSTPAYDLTDCDQMSDRSGKLYLVEGWTNCHPPDSSSLLSPASEVSTSSENASPCEAASNRNAERSDVTDSRSLEDKQTQRIGEILETINVALLQRQRKGRSNETASAELSSVRADDATVGKQESETTVAQQEGKSEVVAGSQRSSRDLVTAQRESEVWQKMPPPQPRAEDRQQSLSCVPQTCASHITICVTPPEPPPRPDHPKGGVSMGYRAIMAARSLGRNAGNKSSVGGGHATFPSPRSLRKRNPLLTSKCTRRTRDTLNSCSPVSAHGALDTHRLVRISH